MAVNGASKTNSGSTNGDVQVDIASSGFNKESEGERQLCQWLLCIEIGLIVIVVVIIWTLSAVACILLGISDSMEVHTCVHVCVCVCVFQLSSL